MNFQVQVVTAQVIAVVGAADQVFIVAKVIMKR